MNISTRQPPCWLNKAILALCITFTPLSVMAAVDTGAFELDGNPGLDAPNRVDAINIYCDDDALSDPTICDGVKSSGATAPTFIYTEAVNSQMDDIFTGGSSDVIDILGWAWTQNGANDKNDIDNAFAGIIGDNLYFGLDVFAENGDAAYGFWFLQNDVGLNADGSFSPGHKDGDILIQADLTNGGSVARFDVYEWKNGGLSPVVTGTECGVTGYNPNACAKASVTDENYNGESIAWEYHSKFEGKNNSVDPGIYPQNAYFEGGINLPTYFKNIPCLTTFIAETRNSQSESASLEDLARGNFALCGFSVSVSTNPTKAGDTAYFTGIIENDGALNLTKDSITIKPTPDSVDTSDCGTELAAGDSCTVTWSYVTTAGDGTNINSRLTATYGSGNSITEFDMAQAVVFAPSVDLEKTVDKQQVLQGESVVYSLKVTNTSTNDSPMLDCTLTDDDLGISKDFTLSAGGVYGPITQNSGALNTPGTVTNNAEVICHVGLDNTYSNKVSDPDSVNVVVDQRVVDLAVSKSGPDFSKVGDTYAYEIKIWVPANSQSDLNLTSVNDPLLGGELDYSSCPDPLIAGGASCTLNVNYTVQPGDLNESKKLKNTVTVKAKDTFDNAASASAEHTVNLISPDFTVTKSCASQPVQAGSQAFFDIQIRNTGDVPLEVDIKDDTLPGIDRMITLGTNTGSCTFNDDPSDGCLELSSSITASGDSIDGGTVTATWTLDPQSYDNLPNTDTKTAGDACDVESGDATRTIGFWRTHGSNDPEPVDRGYTCHVIEHHPDGAILDLGWTQVASCEDWFGIFWGKPAVQTDGKKRPRLCKRQLHASKQMLAAILNTRLDNGQQTWEGNPVSFYVEKLITKMEEGKIWWINKLAGKLADYNESGDDVMIEDSHPVTIPHADPRGTRAIANRKVSDCNNPDFPD